MQNETCKNIRKMTSNVTIKRVVNLVKQRRHDFKKPSVKDNVRLFRLNIINGSNGDVLISDIISEQNTADE